MKQNISPEQAMKQIRKIFRQRGTKALETARREILKEKIECKETREALSYFITEYWHDVTRPSLLSLACAAVGGNPEITTPVAVSMILTSGAMDIHDDIIDESKRKGSRDTVLGKCGKSIALLVGDALMFKGLVLLQQALENEVSADNKAKILDVVEKRFFELGDAEAMELSFQARTDITPKEYLRIVKKKAADMEAYMRIGGVLGGGTHEEIEALGKYGRILGTLIILRDDLIDMIDLHETVQRIRKESLPLPILYALQDTTQRKALVELLHQKKHTTSRAKKVIELAGDSGGMKRTRGLMQRLINQACNSLNNIEYERSNLRLLLYAMISFE